MDIKNAMAINAYTTTIPCVKITTIDRAILMNAYTASKRCGVKNFMSTVPAKRPATNAIPYP